MHPRPVLSVLAGVALLCGCSGGADSSSSSASGPRSETSVSGVAGPDLAASGAGSKPGAAAAPASAGPVGLTQVTGARSVVRTATLRVRVDDVRSAADRARTVAESSGGGLEAEDASGTGDVLRLRVAPERLGAALDALAGLGREQGRTVGSEDVTEQVADLGSRLATQRSSVERVRALLARATSIADVVALEGQLTQREADLESLQARLQAVQAVADLATVTLTLEPATAVAPSAGGFRGGLDAGGAAFLAAARVGAVLVGALLPFLPLLALALYGARRYHRRARLIG